MERESRGMDQTDLGGHQQQELAGLPPPQPLICLRRAFLRGVDQLAWLNLRQFSHVFRLHRLAGWSGSHSHHQVEGQ